MRDFGRRLRRFRRLRGLKQSHIAELLSVSQGLVSRWEAGSHAPSSEVQERLASLIAAQLNSSTDWTLRRLIESADFPLHLICDSTHVLLAASPAREAEWLASADEFRGSSLWRFATDEIVAAESKLVDLGWFEGKEEQLQQVATDGNGSLEMRILPSVLQWEQVGLADGRIGRLVTTVAFA